MANLNGGTCLLGSSVVHWRGWGGGVDKEGSALQVDREEADRQ